jgi:hypothetical protein
MTEKENEKEEIEKLYSKYQRKLKVLNETIWEKKVTQNKISNWLNNFSEDERIHALYLLTQFIYFNEFQVKTLLKSLYRDIFKYKQIHKIRKENNNTLDELIVNKEYKKVLNQTRFITLGNPAESSSELMPIFRKINDLPISLFKHSDLVKECPKEINHFVFIDDLCGSGTQATRYSNNIIPKIKLSHPKAKFSYLMIIGTKSGKNKISEETDFDFVDSVLELDTTYKCFDENSRVFKSKEDIINIDKIKEFTGNYGELLMNHFHLDRNPKMKADALKTQSDKKKFGFGDGQLSLGFHHNTPNNSLPIFWYNDAPVQWVPIFKRINKKYK